MAGTGLVFNTGSVAGAPCDVEIEFADGRHVIPRWMVAHLGGADKVTTAESMAAARLVTFEEFSRRFHAAAGREALNGIQNQVIASHLRKLF